MEEAKGKRAEIVWLDVARFLAMFFVCVSHAGDTFNFNPPADAVGAFHLWGAAWGSLARFCVPTFVMITGFLLLPVEGDALPFYRKRIGRVLLPFLFWSVLYNLLPWLAGLCGGTADFVATLLPYGEVKDLSLGPALARVARIPLNFNSVTSHLWYVYLLIGLYLFLPFLSAWFGRATDKAKRGFLTLWAASLFLPYVRAAFGPLWGECDWNAFGTLYAFAGWTGYLVLGSVLGHMKPLPWSRTLAIAAPLFAAGYAVTFFGFRHMQELPNATSPQIELFFTFCSINVAAMTAALFLVAKKFDRLPARLAALLMDINHCGYGIYLSHYAFIGLLYALVVRPLGLPPALQLPVMAALAYLTVYALIHFLRSVPRLGRFLAG